MGLPGNLALSFLRGAYSEVVIQKAARMGRSTSSAKKIHVLRPPPSFQVM